MNELTRRETTGLVNFDAAILAIEKAKSVDEVKAIRDKAEAARKYAKQAGVSLKGQNMLAEIKLRCERKAGEISKEMPRQPGKRTDLTSQHDVNRLPTKTEMADDMGVPVMTLDRWELEAEVPEEQFEEHVEAIKAGEKELTSASVLRLAKKLRPKPEPIPLPKGKYNVIYADPPWEYGDHLVEGYGAVDNHYPQMSIKELCDMPVGGCVCDEAVLFLWVTSPLLDECWPIISAWGFEYKTSFVWDKVKHNYGHYNSVRHEFLLICTRGSFLPQCKTLHDSVITEERSQKHSEKPESFRQIIETMYPIGKKLELFGRKKTDGWTVFGNEIV